ncbi:hypothetical protein [Demequina lignilytica]|uniref:Membrane protein involved in the export of O-antigen and teichoic acid n=1 Tax=Demequina lignilytica TaxID=3051663 RepID=A0AB35MKD7_9MICO|nr:hypothetical protein [Demequina sp. SYSU T0a273]MDN4484186.1 hypothetical protein [Demequina sp. SYSU T0a273]
MKSRRIYVRAGLVDQAFVSVAGLLQSVVVFRAASASEAVQYSVAFIAYTIALSMGRSLTSEPLAAFGRASSREASNLGALVRAHALVGALTAAVAMSATSAIFGGVSTLAVVFSVGAVCAVALDAVRTTFIASGDSSTAAAMSALLLGGVAIGALASVLTGNPVYVVAAWGTAALLLLAAKVRPFTKIGMASLRPESFNPLAEFSVTSGATQVGALLATHLLSQEVALVQRVGATAAGPYTAFFQGVSLLAVPILAERLNHARRDSRRGMKSAVAAITTFLVLGTALGGWTLVAAPLLAKYGDQVFGESWPIVVPHLVPYVLSLAASAAAASVFLVLRASREKARSASIRALGGALQVGIPIAMGLRFGVDGFYYGAAGASTLVFAVGIAAILRLPQRFDAAERS